MKNYILPAVMLVSTFLFSANAQAKVQTLDVEYKDGSQVLQGYLAYDDATKVKRPGVLVVHEWMGLDKYSKMRAEQLAKLGYVAFAADIFGKGIRPKNTEEAGKMSGAYKADRNLFRSRVNAAFGVLKNYELTDSSKTAAIGYCFGGTGVLELARSGADVNGVVTFHGGLDTPTPQDAKNIKAKVLVLHGAEDPYVPMKDVAAFQDEMRGGNVDWRMVTYADSVHGFTNPNNGTDKTKGVAYNKKADEKSFEEMQQFFTNELFK